MSTQASSACQASPSRLVGVTSLLLVFAACLMAALACCRLSWEWLAAYLAASAVCGGGVVAIFCTKCRARASCAHVLPALLTRLMPPRRAGPYRFWELAWTALCLLVLLGLPQYALWQDWRLWVLFWGLHLVALVGIRRKLCPACGNAYCPACPKGA